MRQFAVILLSALAVFSCSRPLSRETFVLKDKAGVGNTYSFALDLSDSTVFYAISFYTRMNRKPFQPFRSGDIPLHVRWTSPSDSSYSETAVLATSVSVDSSYFSRDFLQQYKQGFRPFEPGIWRLRVQMPTDCDCLLGWGVICKREE